VSSSGKRPAGRGYPAAKLKKKENSDQENGFLNRVLCIGLIQLLCPSVLIKNFALFPGKDFARGHIVFYPCLT